MKIKKRTLRYAVAAVVLLAIAYFLLPVVMQEPLPEPTPTPEPTQAPTQGPTPTPAPTIPPGDRAAAAGDKVSVDYAVWGENGTLFDTSIEEIAREGGLYREGIEYSPMSFTLGRGDVIPGFDNAVVGMRIGDEKEVIIPPADAYGEYDPMLQRAAMEVYSIPRLETVPLGTFYEAFPDFDIATNQTLTVDGWNAVVLSMTSETITIRFDPEINQTIPKPPGTIPEYVYELTDTQIRLKRTAEVGNFYMWYDETGYGRYGTVAWIRDGVVMLDFNHPLAGQSLNFTIRLASIG